MPAQFDLRRIVVVMAKEPRPGDVKTRLTPALSPDSAGRLYEAMLRDVLEFGTPSLPGLDRRVAFAPADAERWFRAAVGPRDFDLLPQRGPDLSSRMIGVFDTSFADHDRVVMRNSDSPHLAPERIIEALDALDAGADLVLGPDGSGGYYLVGLAKRRPKLFAPRPSTRSNFDETIGLAVRLGLRTHVLEPEIDVDYPEDIEALRALLEADPMLRRRCPRTSVWLSGGAKD